MKNTILIIILLLCVISIPSKAQLIKSYGVKIAVTTAHHTWKSSNTNWTYEPEKRRVGFNLALYAEWLNTPLFSILTQLEYTQRGFGEEFNRRDEFNNDLGTITKYTRFDYLSLPILCKVRVPIGTVSPFIQVGPRIDYFLGYKDDLYPNRSMWKDSKENIFGLSFSIGAEINNLLPFILSTEFRYNMDLTNSYESQTLKIRNNAFDFWIGVGL